MIVFAVNNPISGYKSPSYNSLRTNILAKEKSNIDRLLAVSRSMWNEKRVSIVSDICSNSQEDPLSTSLLLRMGSLYLLRFWIVQRKENMLLLLLIC